MNAKHARKKCVLTKPPIPKWRWDTLIEWLADRQPQFRRNWAACVRLRADRSTRRETLRWAIRSEPDGCAWFFRGENPPLLNGIAAALDAALQQKATA